MGLNFECGWVRRTRSFKTELIPGSVSSVEKSDGSLNLVRKTLRKKYKTTFKLRYNKNMSSTSSFSRISIFLHRYVFFVFLRPYVKNLYLNYFRTFSHSIKLSIYFFSLFHHITTNLDQIKQVGRFVRCNFLRISITGQAFCNDKNCDFGWTMAKFLQLEPTSAKKPPIRTFKYAILVK